MNQISIIIPTKNRIEEVKRCIEPILAQTLLPDELVVVDSSDTEELRSWLDSLRTPTKITKKYIHTPPSGLTRARNIGIDNSTGDIIIFIDDDTILEKDYVKEIVYVFDQEHRKKVGAVLGQVIEKRAVENRGITERILECMNQVYATIFFLPRYGNGKFLASGSITFIKRGSVNKITDVECCPGSNQAFKREIFNEFRFDENLTRYGWGEDDDFAYRVSRKYQNIYTPYAKIIHDHSPVRLNKYTLMKMRIDNHYYLFKKNFPQTFKYKFAFYISVTGLFMRAVIGMLVQRDCDGLRGLIAGMRTIYSKHARQKEK